jgi:hypothetical protein
LEETNYWHKTPETNIAILHNMIQACRGEVAIMRSKDEYRTKRDPELCKIANALAQEVNSLYGSDIAL